MMEAQIVGGLGHLCIERSIARETENIVVAGQSLRSRRGHGMGGRRLMVDCEARHRQQRCQQFADRQRRRRERARGRQRHRPPRRRRHGRHHPAGGAGADTFAFPNVMGNDLVTNFGTAKDTLLFNMTLFSNFTAAMNAASQVGANTVFTIDANDTVTLDNVSKSSLTASNFHFS
jgi:Ca2+-binding RTX toxin-like protein